MNKCYIPFRLTLRATFFKSSSQGRGFYLSNVTRSSFPVHLIHSGFICSVEVKFVLTTNFKHTFQPQVKMEDAELVLLFDLINLFYNLAWLVYLTQKHYGQVTTSAGHIFELNVLVNSTVSIFLWILLVDSGALDSWCTLRYMLDGVFSCGYLVALAGSQIETLIFLKTLNVNTMMTNMAGKIILAMTIFTVAMGVLLMLVAPDRTLCEKKTELCEYLKMSDIYRITIPGTIVILIVFAVLGFTLFRSHQIEKKRDIERPKNVGVEGTGELFAVQRAISELHRGFEENQETHEGNVEDDIVVEDVELVTTETHQNSSEQVSIGVMIGEISQLPNTTSENTWNDQTDNQQIPCLEIGLMIQTLNKYFKNTLMSVLILSSELPWYLTAMYGLITNSGCENPTFMLMSEISYYSFIVSDICLPILIKLKLDRLSQ